MRLYFPNQCQVSLKLWVLGHQPDQVGTARGQAKTHELARVHLDRQGRLPTPVENARQPAAAAQCPRRNLDATRRHPKFDTFHC